MWAIRSATPYPSLHSPLDTGFMEDDDDRRLGRTMNTKAVPEPIDILVGNNIRIHRLARKMSQTKLADAIGATFQQVQKYEKGTNRVGPSRLTKISNFLKVPLPDFFDGAQRADFQEHSNGGTPSRLLSEPYALRLLEAFSAIPDPKIRRSLVDVLESIAAKAARFK